MAELSVDASSATGRTVLTPAGELDLDSVERLREPAEAALISGDVTLDLAELTFIDSSGLALLVELRRLAANSGVTLEIANVRPGPRRVIGIAGLTDTLGLSAP